MTDGARGEEPDGGGLRILQITDTHLFSDREARLGGITTEASYAEVFRLATAENGRADLVLATGDLVHDGSEEGYRRFRRAFEEYGVRTLVIPGNHDDPDVMARVFGDGLVTWTESLAVGDWQIIMLNSWMPDSAGGRLGEAQIARLDRRLREHPERPTLVALHHHPVSVGSEWIDRIGLADGEAFMATLEFHPQVRGVVWGHVHQSFEGHYGDIRLMGTPSTCIQFRPASRNFALDARPAGFRVMTLGSGGTIASRVIRVPEVASGLDVACEGYR